MWTVYIVAIEKNLTEPTYVNVWAKQSKSAAPQALHQPIPLPWASGNSVAIQWQSSVPGI